MKILGITLIFLGILMMIFRGFYYTKKEKVFEAGPVEISKKEPKSFELPIYAGALVTIAGVIVLVARKKRS